MFGLAMILTAAMAIPGDGPKMESAGVIETHTLVLDGEWEGVLLDTLDHLVQARYVNDRLSLRRGEWLTESDCWFITDQVGQLQIAFGTQIYPAIYRREPDKLVICYRFSDRKRPTVFKGGKGQDLLTLHRIKPRK